jgi:nitrite reductase (NADH) large subunit
VLVVIGNGMVSERFCERAVELGLHESRRIIVFGEEPVPAYNRVELTRVLGGLDAASLTLKPMAWYSERDIELRIGERVLTIDRERRRLLTEHGCEQPYDDLVLATGSYASTPVIPGTNNPGVLSYRTAEDARRIGARARALARERARVVVVGSGLLGIEAGQAIAELGCPVTFVEAAPQVLPRQLDPGTAAMAAELLLEAGFDLCLGQTIERIVLMSEVRRPHLAQPTDAEVPDTRLRVGLSRGGLMSSIDCGMVVLAAGIKPRDELARQSGIRCPAPGGIEVDDTLKSSDPNVFAIGECARHAGRAPGQIAPGYAMADVLAERLAGRDVRFTSTQPNTRLTLVDRPVLVVGEGRGSDAPAEALIHREPSGRAYRRLIVHEGHLVGMTAIGAGPDLAPLEEAVALRRKLERSDRRRLERGVNPWLTRRQSLAVWPDSAIVCDCTGVTAGALRRACAEGFTTREQLSARTGAGSVCGSCQPRLLAFVRDGAESSRVHAVLGLSALAALLAVALALRVGPIPLSATLQQQAPFELLWRDPLVRQLTGAGLVVLCALSALWLPLRRRAARRRGAAAFSGARGVHAALGFISLIAMGVHTGLRWGRGLDLALTLSLAGMIVIGATTALVMTDDRWLSGPRGTALRRLGTRLHVWIAWPLPVLIALHVLKHYYF